MELYGGSGVLVRHVVQALLQLGPRLELVKENRVDRY